MKISARNQFRGKIASVTPGAVNTEVAIALPDGGEVHATITHRACNGLGLKEGLPATAVFKAPSVILAVPT